MIGGGVSNSLVGPGSPIIWVVSAPEQPSPSDEELAALLDFLDRLGLRFAACDLCVDHSGTWWLIEANPAVQWAWDHPLRDAIASAIADALIQESSSP